MSNSTKTTTLDRGGEQTGPDPGSNGLLSVKVVEAFADAKGVEPAEMDVQLYNHVDTEALNRLHRHFMDMDGTFWSMEFTIDDYEFVVRADGTVSVR